MSKVTEDKAYKVLAEQEGISNSKAKDLIDKGLVYAGNRKVVIARANISTKTKFRVEEIAKIKMPDLNAHTVEAAMEMVAGTARSMGITVEG